CERGDNAQRVRLGAVSSFGFGGSNAHVVLEQAPPLRPRVPVAERGVQLLTLSARNEKALQQLAGQYASALATTDASLGDLCFSANTGRGSFDLRVALAVTGLADAGQALRAVEAQGLA